MKKFFIPISILLLTLTAAAGILSFWNEDLMKAFFIKTTYYSLLLLFLFWINALIQHLRDKQAGIKSFLKEYGLGLLLCFILTVSIFISVNPYYRVLSDEAEIIGISQSMVYAQRPDVASAGVNYGFVFRPLEHVIPRRPLLFSFFTHIVHAVSGYRLENAFAVNFIALCALFSILFILFKKYLGRPWAYMAVLLTAAQPLLIENATSAGIDLLAVLFLVICFMSTASFLKNPSSSRFQILWIHLLLLAQVRYETPVVFAVVLAALAVWRLLKMEYFKSSFVYALTPAFFLPVLWQRLLSDPPYSDIKDGSSAFSFEHFVEHTRVFFDRLFFSNYIPPVASIINILGIIGLLYLLILFVKGKWAVKDFSKRLFIISFFSVLLLWGIVTSYYFGDIRMYATARYFSFFYMLLSLFAVILFHQLFTSRQSKILLLCASSLLYVLYHPHTFHDGNTIVLDLTRRYRHETNFFKTQNMDNVLIITDIPAHYTIQNMGAVNFERAGTFRNQIIADFKNGLYENIFVIQQIDLKTGKPTPETSLDTGFAAEPLYSLQYTSDYAVKILKIKLP